MEWYGSYTERRGNNGRLVQLYSFSESWTSGERHLASHEVVIFTQGAVTLIQELPEGPHSIMLQAGDYAINPRGVWHTADVSGQATVMFITVGWRTEHRGRLGR